MVLRLGILNYVKRGKRRRGRRRGGKKMRGKLGEEAAKGGHRDSTRRSQEASIMTKGEGDQI